MNHTSVFKCGNIPHEHSADTELGCVHVTLSPFVQCEDLLPFSLLFHISDQSTTEGNIN